MGQNPKHFQKLDLKAPLNDTYGGDVREIVVLIMEVDKVVDEATDMEIDR